MGIIRLDHVQLAMPAGREAEADRFYIGLMGFDTETKPPILAARGGRWYQSGSVRLHLGVEEDFRPAKRAHPALIVHDLDNLATVLIEEGYAVEWDENIPGTRRCYVQDPFGNRLELVASG